MSGSIVHKSLKYNAFMNILLTASNMLVSFMVIPFVSRVLSVEGYGAVGFAQSTAGWVAAFCMLGINMYGIRECARVRGNCKLLAQTVEELLVILTVATAVSLAFFAVLILYVPSFSEASSLMWMFLVSIGIQSFGVEWYYQGIEEYGYIAKRAVAFKLLFFILTVVLIRDQSDYLVFGALQAFVICGNNAFNLIRLCRTLHWVPFAQLRPIRHIKAIAPFAVLSIASTVYISLDSTILGMASGGSLQVGYYQLGSKLKNVMWSVMNAVIAVFIPRLASLASDGDFAGYKSTLKGAGLFSSHVPLLILGFVTVFAEDICLVISGEQYIQSANIVRAIALANLFSCTGYTIGSCVLTPLGREKYLALGNIAAVVVSIMMNVTLDARFGAIGAAVSLVAAEAVSLVFLSRYATDYLDCLYMNRNAAKIVLSNGVSTLLCGFVFGIVELGPVFNVIFGFVLYALATFLMLAICNERLAAEIVRRFRRLIHGNGYPAKP